MASNIGNVILDSQEMQDLRARLDSVEAQNASLSAELREAQTAVEAVKAKQVQLAKQLAHLGGLLPAMQECHAQGPERSSALNEPETSTLPFSSLRSPFITLREMRATLGGVNVITARDEFAWDIFPMMGYAIKPDRMLSKKGNWQSVKHGKLLRLANELMARVSGVWHYLGTYTFVSSEVFPAQLFRELPEQVQRRVVALAGHKRHSDELRRMLEDGEVTMTKISFSRTGMNQRVWDCLASHAEVNAGDAQAEGSDDSDATD
ncbi:hypothetical protein EVJ58_g1571 [Rhodofomes roseus]|uniref:Uncharacterized protein n=1 Tax=Rhodofomes roseus TaxID=34475 RepID=A0A4Y9Z112_9APHY|nr:hypothetical protein EVJ58_g1571 [Rhodofomes roseus]